MHDTPNPAMTRWLHENKARLLELWREYLDAPQGAEERSGPAPNSEKHCRQFLDLLDETLEKDSAGDTQSREWADMHDYLAGMARERAAAGSSAAETATFIFSAKYPVFHLFREAPPTDLDISEAVDWFSRLIDQLGLTGIEAFVKSRESIIERQKHELLELATPVVELWEGILAVPLIGTVDSSRAQTVMETLLEQIVASGATVAIIDITGVPTVDTLVAQHLMKTVAATRLMGAECIISGIRPAIAQSIVQLGLDLQDIRTRATLAGALRLAMQVLGTAGPADGRESRGN